MEALKTKMPGAKALFMILPLPGLELFLCVVQHSSAQEYTIIIVEAFLLSLFTFMLLSDPQ